MVTQTTTTFPVLPEFARQPVADIAATVAERLKTDLNVPLQEVAGLTPTQVSAMNLAQQGIGSFQPFLQAAQAAQTAGLGTIGAGAQTVAGAEFVPTKETLDQFRDPYQMDVTREALKEIDRQQQIAENKRRQERPTNNVYKLVKSLVNLVEQQVVLVARWLDLVHNNKLFKVET